MGDQEIKNEVVETMLRDGTWGGKKRQKQTIAGWAVQSHDEGRAKQLIDKMIADPDAPIEAYGGGHRDNIRLTSKADALEYLRDNGRDLPDWMF